MLKAKILVVGPKQSGKSVFSNFLAEHSETIGGDYRPTQGVRILEFEVPNVKVKGRLSTVDVELWDCSGDNKYENCWPAMAKDTNGVIFIYNPDQPNQDKELESWFSYVVPTTGIKPAHALAVSHFRPGLTSLNKIKLPPVFSKMMNIKSNLEEDQDSVRQSFNSFVGNVANAMSDRNEQDELNIMKQS